MTDAQDVTVSLRSELMRLRRANPFEILGVPLAADTEQVRQAFLAATKRRHPNRFAREAPEVRDLANELFLVYRAAYDQLADEAKRKALREKIEASAAAKLPVPPAAQRQTPGQGVPSAQRPTVPAIPSSARPTVPAMPAAAKPGGPAGRPARGSRPLADAGALLDLARARQKRFDEAQAAMAQGRFRDAREAFVKLASEEPQVRRYRVNMHLAWGLEHRHEGRIAEAQEELERAVALEPENAEVTEALRKLEADRKRGLFAKFTGR